MSIKNTYQLEKHFKGAANHYRIHILLFLAESAESTLEEIVEELGGNTKTISEHTRRLVQAGLVNKKYQGRNVAHTLSPYGQQFHEFIKAFQHS